MPPGAALWKRSSTMRSMGVSCPLCRGHKLDHRLRSLLPMPVLASSSIQRTSPNYPLTAAPSERVLGSVAGDHALGRATHDMQERLVFKRMLDARKPLLSEQALHARPTEAQQRHKAEHTAVDSVRALK